MKNLFLILAIASIFFTSETVYGFGDGDLAIIKSSIAEVSLENENQKKFILFSSIDTDTETLQFIFENSVSMIQVYSDGGDLEMVLPIGSDEVDLGLSLFDAGNYKLGFMVDGIDEMQFTNLKIK